MRRTAAFAFFSLLAFWWTASVAAADSLPVPAVRSAAAAPQPLLNTISLRLDSVGLGPAFYGRFSPDWSWSLFATLGEDEEVETDIFWEDGEQFDSERDIVEQYQIGAQARWHFAGKAPNGAYLFGQLAYLDGKFKYSDADTGRYNAHIEKGAQPAAGIGYMSHGKTLVWDIGLCYGSDIKNYAQYAGGGSFRSSEDLFLHLGVGLRL